MANYPDYWPKQMRFREKKNTDDAHRRKVRHGTPGSFHQGYYESSKGSDVISNTNDAKRVYSEHIPSYKSVSEYVNKAKLNSEKSSALETSKRELELLIKRKNKALYGMVFYHEKRIPFSAQNYIGEKEDEYVILFSKGFEFAGAFYNGKGVKFKDRDYGEDGSLRSLSRLIDHLNFKDKCVNFVTNEDWARVLNRESNYLKRGKTSVEQIESIVEKLKSKEFLLKVWHFPDDNGEIQAEIEKVDSVKKL